MHSGLGEVPERVLFSGMDGSWEYSGGLTGFQNIKGDWQEYSGYSHWTYADGSVGTRIEKVTAMTAIRTLWSLGRTRKSTLQVTANFGFMEWYSRITTLD